MGGKDNLVPGWIGSLPKHQRAGTGSRVKRFSVPVRPPGGASHNKQLHACVPVDFEEVHVSSNADEEDIRNAIMAIRRNRVALKGNIETNHNLPPSHKSRNNILRTSLDLYANVIHCKSLPGVVTRHRDIDILIVRENTEGEYSSLEHESVAGVVESLKIITKAKSLRIAEYAFKLAQESGRKKVTAVHKANIMKLGDGLFLQCCKEVAARYPQITFENMIVDNTTMQLVSRPQQFDVMVMPNLYGNIVNNVCAGLVGGPGLVAGANYGHVYAVFETATRNTGKSIANKNIANPTATLLASCMMLDHLKLHSYATSIRKAVLASMDNENLRPPRAMGDHGRAPGVCSSWRVSRRCTPQTSGAKALHRKPSRTSSATSASSTAAPWRPRPSLGAPQRTPPAHSPHAGRFGWAAPE
uniref:isocitrate dehydrogenase [NAD] subunit gamma, mitochondrial isoform X4 n=1 Tax=Halichoerus grypus TaxID=9711 RepID=UPI001658F531|nr:isocitrate dehydrogenase [NAD] subunit gamma, mitochondrial isoform X4 [Halichoerus grypus]